MRKKVLRIGAFVLTLVMMLGLFAGCGAGRNRTVDLFKATDTPQTQLATGEGAAAILAEYTKGDGKDAEVRMVGASSKTALVRTREMLFVYDIDTSGKSVLRLALDLRPLYTGEEVDTQDPYAKVIPATGMRYIFLQNSQGLWLLDAQAGKLLKADMEAEGIACAVSPDGNYLAVLGKMAVSEKKTEWAAVRIKVDGDALSMAQVYGTSAQLTSINIGDNGAVMVTDYNEDRSYPYYFYIKKPGASPKRLKLAYGKPFGVCDEGGLILGDRVWLAKPGEKAVPTTNDLVKEAYYMSNNNIFLVTQSQDDNSYNTVHVKFYEEYDNNFLINNHPETASMSLHYGTNGVVSTDKKGAVRIWQGEAGFTSVPEVTELGVFPGGDKAGALPVGMDYIVGFTPDTASGGLGISFFTYFVPDRLLKHYPVS
nr:hypothetical protein [bacterium]